MQLGIKLLIISGLSGLICISCTLPPTHFPQSIPAPVIKPGAKAQISSISPSATIPDNSNIAPLNQALKPLSSRSAVINAQLPPSLRSLRDIPAVPGGIAWISLPISSPIPPRIWYQQKPVLVLRDGQQWVALVGIPLQVQPGVYYVIDSQHNNYAFTVYNKQYQVQYVKINKRNFVNPNPEELQRIQYESQLIAAALATPWRATTYSPLPLKQPIQGKLSSSFGLRRYFNGQPRKPHSGLDIAAPLGTLVLAPSPGQVVNTGDYFFTGKTVLIDHGQGIITLYGHLNQIKVIEGQTIETGQIIGTVGKTGRATGPHLHWGVSLNQAMINPQLVMQ
jgi:murein DD-endopeptidase MepM/ murein hydrolase activator NlpD